MTTAPFLRWAGGKRRLLPELLARVPDSFERYVEPFLGGGALFFALEPERAILADALEPLITTYRVVRDECETLIKRLEYFEITRERYESARSSVEQSNVSADDVFVLNRGGFNGLWRMRKNGRFDTPLDPGQVGKMAIWSPQRVRGASATLQGAELYCAGFEDTLALARSGDFVYLDPPYDGTFSAYTGADFGPDDRLALALELDQLDARGVKFLLSDSDTAWTRALYAAYRIDEVEVRRSISCKAASRGVVGELMVRNY